MDSLAQDLLAYKTVAVGLVVDRIAVQVNASGCRNGMPLVRPFARAAPGRR